MTDEELKALVDSNAQTIQALLHSRGLSLGDFDEQHPTILSKVNATKEKLDRLLFGENHD